MALNCSVYSCTKRDTSEQHPLLFPPVVFLIFRNRVSLSLSRLDLSILNGLFASSLIRSIVFVSSGFGISNLCVSSPFSKSAS